MIRFAKALLLLLIVIVSACVPNKKVVFLQREDVNAKNLPKDSILRSYEMIIGDYKIQPLDILSVRFESLTDEQFDFLSKLNTSPQQGGGNIAANPALSGFLVDNNGDLEFPVIGKVRITGLSVFEAQDKLRQVVSPYLKDPVVRVRLLNFRFTVLGEVSAERQVVSNNTRVTLMEAIGMAGGLTDLADRQNVKIVRQNGNRSEIFYMDLLDENLLLTKNYYVQQNDIIIVPALRQRPFRKYWGQNITLFVSTVSVVLLTINLINGN